MYQEKRFTGNISSSNINSAIFMEDPVPIKGSDKKQDYTNDDGEFVTKGHKDTYRHVGGKGDVYLIKGEGGSFQLHRQNLIDTLKELRNYADIPVRNLSSETNELFKAIVEALRLLYGSQALYDIVLKDVRDVFNGVTNIKPGTVSAFFIGCFNEDSFPGPLGCSPKCASSLPPSDGTPGYDPCEDLVLIYKDGVFSSLNEKKTDHVYIYIENNDFTGFTNENINQLREVGVANSTIIFGNPDGSYGEINGPMGIDKLPLKMTTNQVTPKSSDPSPANISGIIVIIIAVIAIILLLFVLFFPRRMMGGY